MRLLKSDDLSQGKLVKKKHYVSGAIVLIIFVIVGLAIAKWSTDRGRIEQLHYEREETELIVSNLIGAQISLFKAGRNFADTARIAEFTGERLWLPRGNYFWKKNPDAVVTVVGIQDSYSAYRPNRSGLYHVTGNVVEWTQSINRAYNRERPYVDDDRNHDDTAGLRVARGGSWYSASIAILYIPYRDAFQPEHSTQDIGFRIVAKLLP
ncbi:formylglycine-generating enzyme family protein [candidate division KSB1 bacterium]|nr:formylglycine-generating enzyme family protein [candidate division KSB1 bacterium]